MPASETAIAHLDHCLGCLSCQPVCPSKVQYDDILIATRALLARSRAKPNRIRRWLRNPAVLVRFARIGSILRAERWLPRWAGLLPKRSLARRLAIEMPGNFESLKLPVIYRRVPARGRITLFPGCVASVFDRDTLTAARFLLEALGFEVVEPTTVVCCGALALHAGDTQAAAATAESTRAALEDCGSPTILVSASGCLGSLRDHAMQGTRLAVADILGFVAADERIDTLRFQSLPKRAALHLPCTQMNVGTGAGPLRSLLMRIPQLQLLTLPDQPRCCGAAGSYFIEQPERADLLRAEKLDQIEPLAPDFLLTTNIGCRIFLGNGLRQRRTTIPILHPLALLARQLETNP